MAPKPAEQDPAQRQKPQRLPEGNLAPDTEYLFLGNIVPVLQLNVRRAFSKLRTSALDTMNYWITGMPDDLAKVLATVDILLINEGEARMLSGQNNLKKGDP